MYALDRGGGTSLSASSLLQDLNRLQDEIETALRYDAEPGQVFAVYTDELDHVLEKHCLEEYQPSFPEEHQTVDELYGSIESVKILAEAYEDDPDRIRYGDPPGMKENLYSNTFKYGFLGGLPMLPPATAVGVDRFLDGDDDITPWLQDNIPDAAADLLQYIPDTLEAAAANMPNQAAALLTGSLGVQALEVGVKKNPKMLLYGIPLTVGAAALQAQVITDVLTDDIAVLENEAASLALQGMGVATYGLVGGMMWRMHTSSFDKADITFDEAAADLLEQVDRYLAAPEKTREDYMVPAAGFAEEMEHFHDSINTFYDIDPDTVLIDAAQPGTGPIEEAKAIALPFSKIRFYGDEEELTSLLRFHVHELSHIDGHNEGNAELKTYEVLHAVEDEYPGYGFQQEAEQVLLEATADAYKYALQEELSWTDVFKGLHWERTAPHRDREQQEQALLEKKLNELLEDGYVVTPGFLAEQFYSDPRLQDLQKEWEQDSADERETLQEHFAYHRPRRSRKRLVEEWTHRAMENRGLDEATVDDLRSWYNTSKKMRLFSLLQSVVERCDWRGPYTVDMYRKWKNRDADTAAGRT